MAERCPACKGYGCKPGKPPCEKCGGTGYLPTVQEDKISGLGRKDAV
jgi:DnaJ-class molecular chaperone